MRNPTNIYFYNKRYTLSRNEAIENFTNKLKTKFLLILYKYNFTTKRLHILDIFSLRKRTKNGLYSFEKRTNLSEDEMQEYIDLYLSEIDYFEALEIDNLDKYTNNIIYKFSNDKLFKSSQDKENLKRNLAEIKKKLDTISWGSLFYIDYEKRRKQSNDLISIADVTYIKTNESFFIIKIKIKPSEKFKMLFAEIIKNEDFTLSRQHFHSFIKILKTKRFHSHESFNISSKCLGLENLLSDLNQQVKKNLTKNFKGYFHNSKIDALLPTIEYYEVKNINEFHNDKSLKQNFNTGFDGYYSIEDNKIDVYFSNTRKRPTLLQIVKEKGHGKKEQTGNDLTDYDWVETHYLLNSLAFPCVFRGIMIEQFEKLNLLKREIYDFSNSSKHSNFITNVFKYNNTYLKLKQTLVEILITTKRFENEFTKNRLGVYTNEYKLDSFTPRNYRRKTEKKNLLYDIVEEFSIEIKSLNDKTNSINDIFKSIEELNSYRTSYLLQIVSLLIAILAFIFAFDKAKNLFNSVFSIIFK